MKVHCAQCPNCSRSFYFPLEYQGSSFQLLCCHCYVGYELKDIEVSEQSLSRLISARFAAPLFLKPWYSGRIFRHLTAVTQQFHSVTPTQPNAVVFLVLQTQLNMPLAIYFQQTYLPLGTMSRIVFSAALAVAGAMLLLAAGLALIPVLVGALIAEICFTRFTALPKIKGDRKRLQKEQRLLLQCHKQQQALQQVHQDKTSYQQFLSLLQVVDHSLGTSQGKNTNQVNSSDKTIEWIKDYLGLCDRAINHYEAAIRSAVIQIQASQLCAELSSHAIDPNIEFGLDQLADQLANHPSKTGRS